MATEGNLEYALARVHARYSRRMSEPDWRRLEANRDLAQYIDAARGSSLADWVACLDPQHDSHDIERSLRAQWRRYVENVASWHSHRWQRSLRWLAWLPMLSLLARLARPEPAPGWLSADPVYAAIASKAPLERATALESTPLAPFERALREPIPMARIWREHWLSLMPPMDADTRKLLRRLLRALDLHAAALADTQRSGGELRKELAGRLESLFRAGAGSVIATVCHLGLAALELERLWGGLAMRHAFPADSPEVA